MTARAREEGRPLELLDYSRTAVATGLSARTVRELRERVATVPAASLFHHFWGRLLRADAEAGEYGNDLAEWAARGLGDAVMAERLALVDPLALRDIERLRESLCQILEIRIGEVNGRAWEAPPDRAFHFVSDQLVVYPTGRSVRLPEELPGILDEISAATVVLHFVDPPGIGIGDGIAVAGWVRQFGPGYESLAVDLESVDAFLLGLEELRQRLRTILDEHLGPEVEA